MNNESFYLRLIKMIPGDVHFQSLYDAIEAGDLTAAFEAAHALKGSTGNLALTPIFAPVSEITELLRVRTNMDYTPLIEAIRDGQNRLQEICAD
jgi:HPt (histidine-containing phosphotransfer) domain-containing protein